MKPKYPSLIENYLNKRRRATDIMFILLIISTILILTGIVFLAFIDALKDYPKKSEERKHFILIGVGIGLLVPAGLLYLFYLK